MQSRSSWAQRLEHRSRLKVSEPNWQRAEESSSMLGTGKERFRARRNCAKCPPRQALFVTPGNVDPASQTCTSSSCSDAASYSLSGRSLSCRSLVTAVAPTATVPAPRLPHTRRSGALAGHTGWFRRAESAAEPKLPGGAPAVVTKR
eukprot:scaffold170281_cov29-Tisochrysis_lutea.AAC.5